jgi:hypothetical protein
MNEYTGDDCDSYLERTYPGNISFDEYEEEEDA